MNGKPEIVQSVTRLKGSGVGVLARGRKHILALGFVVVFVMALGFWLKFGFLLGSVGVCSYLLEVLIMTSGVAFVMILFGSVWLGFIMRGTGSWHRVLYQHGYWRLERSMDHDGFVGVFLAFLLAFMFFCLVLFLLIRLCLILHGKGSSV